VGILIQSRTSGYAFHHTAVQSHSLKQIRLSRQDGDITGSHLGGQCIFWDTSLAKPSAKTATKLSPTPAVHISLTTGSARCEAFVSDVGYRGQLPGNALALDCKDGSTFSVSKFDLFDQPCGQGQTQGNLLANIAANRPSIVATRRTGNEPECATFTGISRVKARAANGY
tara:strand:+ start:1145 stop:1654 length:510 start_codon:yes stop_codon:yes gene_type:complete